MKLITLNTLGGKLRDPLSRFIVSHAKTDIFCFQEVFHDLDESTRTTDFIFDEGANEQLFEDIQSMLPRHRGFFCPIHGAFYGLAMFVKNDINVAETGEVLLYENAAYDPTGEDTDHGRKLQWAKIVAGVREILIMNMHGHWSKVGKRDDAIRIEQSRRIAAFLKQSGDSPKVLCGDFNLRPDTESVRTIEEAGMVNLITKHEVSSTRTSLYAKPERFADFIFLSPDVEEKDFRVLPDEVSDHSPLFVEFK